MRPQIVASIVTNKATSSNSAAPYGPNIRPQKSIGAIPIQTTTPGSIDHLKN